MSGVVLRCPHCGTTRASPGECDACHEENVRYYCTNHSPGRWLDAPTCGQCGARFGEPVRRPAADAGRPRPVAAPRPGGPGRPAPPAVPRPGRPPARARGSSEPESRWPGHGADRLPPGHHEPPPPPAPWDELLRHAARVRREAADRRGPVELPRARGPRLGGCLVRLLLLLVLMMFAAFSGLFLFAGSLFQMFRLY